MARQSVGPCPDARRPRLDDEYCNKSGVALIISTRYDGLEPQVVPQFKSMVEGMNYEVILKTDLSSEEMKTAVRDVAVKKIKAKHDSFICCIMSNGDNTGVHGVDYGSHDHYACDHVNGYCQWAVTVEELARMVSPEKCRNLANKPKIFIIEASRGKERPIPVNSPDHRSSQPFCENRMRPKSSQPVLLCSDYLLAYSTVAAAESMRHPIKGSVYIRLLCEVFREHSDKLSLYEMLLLVHKKMADPKDCTGSGIAYRQMGEIVSTLRKKVYFKKPCY